MRDVLGKFMSFFITTFKKVFKNELVVDSFKYLVVDFFSRVFKFLFIPAFAYLLPLNIYGKFSLDLSFIIFLSLSISLNTPNFFRHLTLKFFDKINRYWSSLFLILFFLGSIHLLVVLLFGINEKWYYLIGISVSYCIANAYNFYLLGLNKKLKYLVEMTIVNTLLYFSVFLYFLIVKNFTVINELDIYIFHLCTGVVTSVYILFKIIKKHKIYFFGIITELKHLLQKNIPLIFHALSGLSLIYIDRIFISEYHGDETLGNYTFIYSFFMIFNFISTSMNNSFIPKFYKKLHEKKYIKAMNELKKILTLSFFLVLLSPLIYFFAILIKPNQIDFTVSVFFTLCGSSIFIVIYSLTVNYLMFNELTKTMSIYSLLSIALNITLNFILIPKYSELGAAISTLFSYIFLSFLCFRHTYVALKN